MVNHVFNLLSPPATGCSATALHLGCLGCCGVDNTRGEVWYVASLLSLLVPLPAYINFGNDDPAGAYLPGSVLLKDAAFG